VHGSSTAIYHTVKHLMGDHRLELLLCHLYSQGGKPDLSHPNLNIGYVPQTPLDGLGYKGLAANPLYYLSARRAMEKLEGDIIQSELLWTSTVAAFLKNRYRRPMVLVEENVEYLKFRRFGINNPLVKLVYAWEGWACRQADHVVAVSEVDKSLLVETYGISPRKIAVIPHCVDLDVFAYDAQGAAAVRSRLGLRDGQPLLTFVGKLDYIPNARAVSYISRLIRPAVMERHPDARFLIIGQGAESLPEQGEEGLIFSGFIDARAEASPNLSHYLSASDVVLVPLDSGSGTRLKILEAAGCARAIVSTQIGAEGQAFRHFDEIMLSEHVDNSFVENVLAVLDDADLRKKLGDGARARVTADYNWASAAAQFREVYRSLLDGRVSTGERRT
jgi:glycosyltransferase involved in cell wall biosynthesis